MSSGEDVGLKRPLLLQSNALSPWLLLQIPFTDRICFAVKGAATAQSSKIVSFQLYLIKRQYVKIKGMFRDPGEIKLSASGGSSSLGNRLMPFFSSPPTPPQDPVAKPFSEENTPTAGFPLLRRVRGGEGRDGQRRRGRADAERDHGI